MLKHILTGIVLNGCALYLVTKLLPDIHYTGGLSFFILAGSLIGFLNTFVRPLMKLLSFPLVLMTIGLFTIVINIVIFWLTMKLVNGIGILDVTVSIEAPLTYVWAALLFGLVNWGIHLLIHNR